MPNITAVGDYDKTKPGFEFLQYQPNSCGLAFSGATLPTTLQVGFLNDAGAFVPLTGGTVTVLPASFIVDAIPQGGLIIRVTGGAPSFNVSAAGRG
jgi:hypothetical protein